MIFALLVQSWDCGLWLCFCYPLILCSSYHHLILYFDPSMVIIRFVCCLMYSRSDFSSCWNLWFWIRSFVQLSCYWMYSDGCMHVCMYRVHSKSCFRLSFDWISVTWDWWVCCCGIQHDVDLLFVLWGCIPLRYIVWFLLVNCFCWRGIKIQMNLGMVKVIAYPLSKLHGWF